MILPYQLGTLERCVYCVEILSAQIMFRPVQRIASAPIKGLGNLWPLGRSENAPQPHLTTTTNRGVPSGSQNPFSHMLSLIGIVGPKPSLHPYPCLKTADI